MIVVRCDSSCEVTLQESVTLLSLSKAGYQKGQFSTTPIIRTNKWKSTLLLAVPNPQWVEYALLRSVRFCSATLRQYDTDIVIVPFEFLATKVWASNSITYEAKQTVLR